MRVGLDFDNTIACYNDVFRAIVKDMDVVPADTPANKTAIRDYLRAEDREDEWTALQGYVYGDGMVHARPFSGAREFIERCHSTGIDVYIISHRTQHPYSGPRVDLHAAARTWLEEHGIVSDMQSSLSHDLVHFEVTKADKLARITARECHWFVDDLPEFLGEPEFPSSTRRVLFDPHNVHKEHALTKCHSWDQITAVIFEEDAKR